VDCILKPWFQTNLEFFNKSDTTDTTILEREVIKPNKIYETYPMLSTSYVGPAWFSNASISNNTVAFEIPTNFM